MHNLPQCSGQKIVNINSVSMLNAALKVQGNGEQDIPLPHSLQELDMVYGQPGWPGGGRFLSVGGPGSSQVQGRPGL